MTEGILLRMMAGDPQLSDFDVVIIDEVRREGGVGVGGGG
jgi:HrpA-like RNA helicase